MAETIVARTTTNLVIAIFVAAAALLLLVGQALAASPVAGGGDPSAEGPAQPPHPPRIIGGSTTSISSHPWQVALVKDARFGGDDFQRHECGGSLITTYIVLTAAHCIFTGDPDGDNSFYEANDVDLVLDRTQLSAGGGVERDAFTAPYYHSGYNGATNANDIAYIVLAQGISGGGRIRLAGADEGAVWAPGAPTFTSGWGLTSDPGTGSDVLKSLTVPRIADSTCASGDVWGSDFLSARMVCAGYLSGGADSCSGDSGGPLVAPAQGGISRLIGVNSFGADPCDAPNGPGVYSRVGDTALRNDIVFQVNQIETAVGVPHESIVGSGALPLVPPSPPASVVPATSTLPKKCKKGQKLKQGKCVKKKKRRKRR